MCNTSVALLWRKTFTLIARDMWLVMCVLEESLSCQGKDFKKRELDLGQDLLHIHDPSVPHLTMRKEMKARKRLGSW